jgi:predicted NUDIX family NTP pyrophosphohydrolase
LSEDVGNKKMKISAGLLMYRRKKDVLEYFLVHPGGPFFKNKDLGYWTIPKGEVNEGEELFETAQREFLEETGIKPMPPYFMLGQIKQKGGKIVHAWAFEMDSDNPIQCNTFSIEWPPKSGRMASFAEVDMGAYFKYEEALLKINQAQAEFIIRLKTHFS